MSTYRTKEGDVLDAICLAQLGSEDHVSAVLDMNPGLAALGPIYPAGVVIELPVVVTSAVKTGEVRLWGRT